MPSAKIIKGELSYLNASAKPEQRVVFQFNPERLTRRQAYTEQTKTLSESIHFTLVLNAMQGMEQGLPTAMETGIYPHIAALEELLARTSKPLPINLPAWLTPSRKAGLLVLTYGARIIPVSLQRLTIKELLHNSQLQPIHASVDLTLRVLTEQDLRGNALGQAALTAYQQYRHRNAQLIQT
ncbi:MAG: hypothetical protein RRB22_05390 [Gammaproteobacteria bacterium]|nr:hypothetical protein [Gammaproteobacteria bacterium]